MTINTVYGTYTNTSLDDTIETPIVMSLSKEMVLNDWNSCSLTSNKISSLYLDKFPNQTKIANLISHIFNELIENAVKYSDEKENEIKLQCIPSNSKIELEAYNITNIHFAERFDKYIKETMHENLEEVFYKYLLNAAESTNTDSGIGLLLIRKDFNANASFKIMPNNNNAELFDIYVKIELAIEDISKL